MSKQTIKFIDLFAGMGGIRLGFEQACQKAGIETACVLTSEIKPYAIQTLDHNFSDHNFQGDLCEIKDERIPDFDFLFAGFPCQPFSTGGKRHGFSDTRGTLFFEIERILRAKRPTGFILENVEGLVRHGLEQKSDRIGRTLKTILYKLEHELGYCVSWKVLDSADFGVPQTRRRIFIVGTQTEAVSLAHFPAVHAQLIDVLEHGLEPLQTVFTKRLLSRYSIRDLYGKSIKDKRGGGNNIHSWDIGLKGECTPEQLILLNTLMRARRKKQWAKEIGITWMDGMPLTTEQISTFYTPPFSCDQTLQAMLDDLVDKGYLRFEHPKELLIEQSAFGKKTHRAYDETKPKGYNIVTGKLSFEINKVLDPYDISPTLVATDMSKLAVPDGNILRRLTKREGLRLCGYPEWYEIPIEGAKVFDLLGNTVVVPVVEAISERIITCLYGEPINYDQDVVSSPQLALLLP